MGPETVLQTITGYHIALLLLAWAAWRWLMRPPRSRGNANQKGGTSQTELVAPQPPGSQCAPLPARRGPGGPSEKEMM